MEFREKLLATLAAIQPVLEEPGVMVVGSEVPNLLEPGAAATLVVSQDIDIGVPVQRHAAIKEKLRSVSGLHPSPEEPSVWLPSSPGLIEVNFLGLDPTLQDITELYVLDDPELPLLVFGGLSLLRPGPNVQIESLSVPVPRPAGLLVEKLLTDRSAEKGDRDLLVALGLLLLVQEEDLREVQQIDSQLLPELRFTLRSNLTILSLLETRSGMPDPLRHREHIVALLRRLGEVP